jgi:hypothetical protein
MSSPDLLAMARAALGASAASEDLATATFYAASARIALEQLREELASTARLLAAREAELVRRAQPRAQLPMEGT